MQLHDPISDAGPSEHILNADNMIVVAGDSNTRRAGRPSYADELQRTLGKRVRVVNAGSGGHTAADGEKVLRNRGAGALLILMYGTNDAAPRWILSSRRPVPTGRFKGTLCTIIWRARAQGAEVLVLAPPPSATPAMEARLQPYRLAARQAAITCGASFADTVQAFTGRGPELERDGLHLSDAGKRKMARWLAQRIALRQ